MKPRYRTSFMAPSGFTSTSSGPSKSSKRIAPASDKKAGTAQRPQVRGAPELKAERPGKSEAA